MTPVLGPRGHPVLTTSLFASVSCERQHFHIVVPSTEPRSSQTPVVVDPDRDPIVDIPHNYKMRSILQDQTNPASDDPSPHLSKAVFFPWTRSSIRTLWGGGRATRMPWRGASEDQPPGERWDRVVAKWKDCMAVCAGNQDERLRTVTWALEFDTLHPLVCVGGDTGIIHVFNVESWEMVGAMTGHGGTTSSPLRTTIRLECGPWPIQWMYPPCQYFGPVRKKSRLISMAIGDLARSMAIGPSERPHFIPVDALVMRTGPPGGVPDLEQAGKGKGACIAVFKGAGSLLGGHDSWVMHADRAIKIWRVPDFPTPETRPERGVNYHIVERPLFSCTHLHETGVEYVSWLKEDVLVSISSNFPRIHAGDEEELDDKDRIDVSGTIVVWQWLDLNRFAPEGAEIKEHLVKPSYWVSRMGRCMRHEFILIWWSRRIGQRAVCHIDHFRKASTNELVHVVDIQKYNQSPEEVKSRMKDPEIRAARRGNRREVRYGNRVELKDVPRAQLYAGNSSQSYSILGAVQNPHSPGMIIGLGKDGLLMLWRDGGLRPWSEGVGLGA
ncbi:hypothetical protein AG1IA_08921 [Rhizoctonia solani AG-1 IA]|uniref:WD40 domain-containing protein n=1 Tax=Thanatephorus cucumeris (strain AG1-IA) TaxID=983506 RepID=L8WJY3_THACA|nr:hypothetical protein AG1IA_08921 [Rhizoctonia solani AG-1 IA]